MFFVFTYIAKKIRYGRSAQFFFLLCSHIFLVLRDHVVYMYVVYIRKWSTAHALGGVSGVATFISTDERLQ